MTEIKKRTTKLIRFLIIPNFFETLIVIVAFLLLPTDSKIAWLLGYSKSRLFIMGSFLLYILVLIYFFISLSSPPKRFGSLLQKIKAHPSTNYSIELICGVCLLIIYACGFYFFNVIPTDQGIEAIHVRLIPLAAYFTVFIIQLFIFLILFRLILGGENFSVKKIWLNATLPIIRGKVFDKMDTFITFTAKNLSKTLLKVVFIFTPALLTTAFIWMFFSTTIFSYMPNGPDVIMYWHETLAFVHYGFSGGNYTLYGTPPLAEFSAFGFHGPAYPVLYGSLGRIIGWEYYTGVLINFFVITLALFLFTRLNNLDDKQLLIGIFLIGTYWPMTLYLSANLTESINHAIAILLAVLFFKQLESQENNWKINSAIFLILLISLTIRVTWSLLFFPFFFFMTFHYRWYKVLGAVVLSVMGILLSFLYTRYFYHPGPDTLIFRAVLHGQLNIQEMLRQIGPQILRNIQNLIDEPDTPFYIQAFRYQITGMAIFIVFKLINYFKRQMQAIKSLLRSELMFHFFNIVALYASVIFIYQVADTRDYRNLAHGFLLSALLLLLFSRYRYVYPIMLMNALLLFSFIPGYIQQRANNYVYDEYRIRSFSKSIADYIEFDDAQSNRWCNTLGYQGKLNIAFVTVDAGIGLSEVDYVLEEVEPKYLLLQEEYVTESKDYLNSLGMQRLVKTDLGILYYNPNSDCE